MRTLFTTVLAATSLLVAPQHAAAESPPVIDANATVLVDRPESTDPLGVSVGCETALIAAEGRTVDRVTATFRGGGSQSWRWLIPAARPGSLGWHAVGGAGEYAGRVLDTVTVTVDGAEKVTATNPYRCTTDPVVVPVDVFTIEFTCTAATVAGPTGTIGHGYGSLDIVPGGRGLGGPAFLPDGSPAPVILAVEDEPFQAVTASGDLGVTGGATSLVVVSPLAGCGAPTVPYPVEVPPTVQATCSSVEVVATDSFTLTFGQVVDVDGATWFLDTDGAVSDLAAPPATVEFSGELTAANWTGEERYRPSARYTETFPVTLDCPTVVTSPTTVPTESTTATTEPVDTTLPTDTSTTTPSDVTATVPATSNGDPSGTGGGQQSVTSPTSVPWLLFLAAVVVAAALGWWLLAARRRKRVADADDPEADQAPPVV